MSRAMPSEKSSDPVSESLTPEKETAKSSPPKTGQSSEKNQLARKAEKALKTPPPVKPPEITPIRSVPLPPGPSRPGHPKSLRALFRSALWFVGIPTLIATIYYGIVASDQFSSRAEFIIKLQASAPQAGMGLLGMGSISPLSIADMLVVKEYVSSPQILRDINPYLDVAAIYSKHQADWVARLREPMDFRRILTGEIFEKGLWAPIREEDVLDYWRQMVVVRFDMTTGIASLQVKAFSPDEALLVADTVLKLGERLVNQISERAREDALVFSKREVEEAHKRAIASLDALQQFQEKAKQIDPEGFARARSEIQAKLESDLAQYQAQLDTLRKDLPDDAPGIQQIKNRILVLTEQLASQKIQSTRPKAGEAASEVLNEFGKKRLDSQFATEAYMSALASLETARRDATQQSRYLEAFVRPQLPQKAEYPKRLQNVLIVFFGAALLWGLGRLFLAVAKEHL